MHQIFTVQGMSCGHCEKTIVQALKKIDAFAQVHVDLDAQRVEVQSSKDRTVLISAIEEEGYTVVTGPKA